MANAKDCPKCLEKVDALIANKDSKFDAKLYEKKILKKFGYYDDVYRIVRMKMDGKLNSIKHLKLLMSMYRNMKREEKR